MAQSGLLAFNSFLSTSRNSHVSLKFGRLTVTTSDSVDVIFVMTVDLSISAISFANVKNVSCYKREDEILFLMYAVFRIEQVKQIKKSIRRWQIDLTLTEENDPQIYKLTEIMRKDT